MRLAFFLARTIACVVAISVFTIGQSQAIRLRDGTVYFAQPPDLLDVTTTFNGVNVWGATYYFTLSLPDNAGEPLHKVTINQREGVDKVRFNLKDTYAKVGKRSHDGNKLTLRDVTSDRKTQTLTLTFDPPVAAGQTITIALKPKQNPSVEGVYLFGVTAFPQGEKAHGQFLGFGRLHFYSPSNDSVF